MKHKFTEPVKYDDSLLKQITCSHIETDTFFTKTGCKIYRCKACQLWSDDLTEYTNMKNYMEISITDYCEMCDRNIMTDYEYKDDYICKDCYTGLADKTYMEGGV